MSDQDILARVDELVSEERALRERGTGRGLAEDERLRLSELEVRLDQCWDLLRQRRARAEFGDDPDGATPRPAREVEGYQS
ncbi:DUF2630 family protein [Streptomyces sp. NBRC 109706]|uniref:DUF2630 family protein n=1 Tax=Streptomyces sp. NBRC 109706 TaxID=1550035 RepID=UPI0007856035|nr:DUF2630 family protein [Streptomyces sp. NBRC 109706]